MTPSDIEPATFWLKAQCLNQLVARKVHNKNPDYENEISQTALACRNNDITLIIR